MAAIFPNAVFLLGPTASGKTALALRLADRFPMEIISVDSALVYRDMNIGTAKPDAATLEKYPHRLIDVIDPPEAYSAARFCEEARTAMLDIARRGKVPLLVGGTMLYVKALTEGLSALPQADPAVRAELADLAARIGWPAMHAKLASVDPPTAARLAPADSQRIQRALEVHRLTGSPLSALQVRGDQLVEFPWRALKLGLVPHERTLLHARIAERFDTMLAQGFVEEVKLLRRRYVLDKEMPSMRCVGYRQVWDFLDGAVDEKTMISTGIAATRQLAKRQMTWLRAMSDVVTLDCFDNAVAQQAIARTEAFLHS